MSLTADLLKDFEAKIQSIQLIPSDGGRHEITVNGDLIYSKLATGRQPEYAEIRKLVEAKLRGSAYTPAR